jgi:hypothetical protein
MPTSIKKTQQHNVLRKLQESKIYFYQSQRCAEIVVVIGNCHELEEPVVMEMALKSAMFLATHFYAEHVRQ